MMGERLAELRKQASPPMTQEDLAAAISEHIGRPYSYQSVQKLERGGGARPCVLQAITRIFTVSTDYLHGFTGDRTPPTAEGIGMAEERGEEEHPEVERGDITPEEAIANYQLILDEPNLHLNLKGSSLTVQDHKDIADYIRFVRERENRLRSED